MKISTKLLVQGALIAAVYAILTLAVAPIASGLVQCRVSEAMCVLPYFTPAAVPGLFVGCMLANLITGAEFLDILLGSLATLLAAAAARQATKWFRDRRFAKWLIPLPSVVFNAFLVGYVLAYVYEVGVSYWLCVLYVALGQLAACYVLGIPLFLVLDKYKQKIFR